MKRLVIILIIVGISGIAHAEIDMSVIAQIESSGRTDAIGDGGKALGMYQLHTQAVSDVNRYLKTLYKHEDALDSIISLKLANTYMNEIIPLYLAHYGLKDSLENRLTAWNMGIGTLKNGKRADKYIEKYRRLTR